MNLENAGPSQVGSLKLPRAWSVIQRSFEFSSVLEQCKNLHVAVAVYSATSYGISGSPFSSGGRNKVQTKIAKIMAQCPKIKSIPNVSK